MPADPSAIRLYHAHVYYRLDNREQAAHVREEIGRRFDVKLGRWHDALVGPHPCSMYQVAFRPEILAELVPWLMLNRAGLDILVHPETGDDIADHTRHALWLGEPLPLRLDVLAQGVTT